MTEIENSAHQNDVDADSVEINAASPNLVEIKAKRATDKTTKVLIDESVLGQIRRQQVLGKIDIAINQTHQLAPLLKQVVLAVEKHLPATGGSSIVLWDEETQSFINSASSIPKQADKSTSKRVRKQSGATRWIIDNAETLVVPDVREDPFTANKMLGEYGLQAYIGIPLVVDKNCIGVLYALSKETRNYTAADIVFLEALASKVAAAIKNVALLEEVQRANDALRLEKIALEKSQRQLAQSLTELEHVTQEKSRFFASMSHEIRTPLNAIIGFAELLQEEVYGELEAKQMRAVGDIFDSGTHLLGLVNDLLDLAKLDAGKFRLEPTEIDIYDFLRNSLNYIRPQAAEKNIDLSIYVEVDDQEVDNRESDYCGSAADPLLVVADKQKLRQIVLNLLSNAVKYTPEGGSIVLGLFDKPNHHSIFVKDSGIGISKADQTQLFQEFIQIDSDMNQQYKGTGLGLVLSQRLAKLHGGTINLESLEGVGSTFSFELPKEILF